MKKEKTNLFLLLRHRFGASSLHQRDSRSALFAGYNDDSQTRRGGGSQSPGYNGGAGGGYGYAGYSPNSSHLSGSDSQTYRSATPNKKGQYSDAVLNELESQNDEQVAGILGKVKTLKSVSYPPFLFPTMMLPIRSLCQEMAHDKGMRQISLIGEI